MTVRNSMFRQRRERLGTCSGHLKNPDGRSGRARAELGSSLRKLGLPTCGAASPTIRQRGCTNSCVALAITREGSRCRVSAFADPRCSRNAGGAQIGERLHRVVRHPRGLAMMVGGHPDRAPDIALVPPSFSDFSTTSTRRPPTAATRAQTNPAAPGPTTTTSISFGIPGLAHRKSR